jgi:8-amino-7-oxononanoate synthase
MDSLDAFAQAKLAGLEARKLKRTIVPTARLDGVWVERAGRRLLSFSCNDYLNLSHDPAVKTAAKAALDLYGVGAAASRLVTGDHPLTSELEARIAAWKGQEAACLFGSGYLANAGTIPAFVGEGDVVIADELAHACIWAGARLSGAEVLTFRHNDVDHLAQLLASRTSGRALVCVEGVYSMDGDVAPLGAISDVCKANDAWLLVDDAHGLGVLAGGRGTAALFPEAEIPLAMGTLSKALASYGGYVAGSRAVIDLLKTRARTVIYSTGLPPASVAAALAALDRIESDPDLVAGPLAKARAFTRAANLPEATSAIVPVVLGTPEAALAAQAMLEAEGFLVTAIRPPTVPEGTARLRIAFTAGHPDSEIERLAGLVRSLI